MDYMIPVTWASLIEGARLRCCTKHKAKGNLYATRFLAKLSLFFYYY